MSAGSPSPRGPSGAEQTRLSWPLIGFYSGCAGVAIGATVAAAGPMWFQSTAAMVVGVAMVVVSTILCVVGLSRARRVEPPR